MFWLILPENVCDRNIWGKIRGILEGEFVYIYGFYDRSVKKYMFKGEEI